MKQGEAIAIHLFPYYLTTIYYFLVPDKRQKLLYTWGFSDKSQLLCLIVILDIQNAENYEARRGHLPSIYSLPNQRLIIFSVPNKRK